MPATLRHLATAAVLFAALAAASAAAQVLPAGPKKLPDAKTVLGLLGSPESKMFDTFGPPDDVTPQGKKNPVVRADYGDFAFSIRDKLVIECYAWSQLPGDTTIGFNFGDTLDDVTKKLGKSSQLVTNSDGSGEADFPSSDKSYTIRMIFNPKKQCIGYGVLKSG